MKDWLFDDLPNIAVLTTYHILEGRTILHVSHNEDDGAWQFHTGETFRVSDARVVALNTIFKLDPSVMQLADLPLGWIADRSEAGAIWQRHKRSESS